jgi:peptide/nickel transport system permease protein
MSFVGYLVKRLLYTLPLLLGAVVVVFILIHSAPGDPVDYIIGEAGGDREMVERLKASLGLDQPLPVQLFRYIIRVMHFDLGQSYALNAPVLTLILDRLPATLLLMGSQLVLSVIAGIALGILSARRLNSFTDNAITVFSLACFALPIFWVGQMLILIFAFYFDWFPLQGMMNLRAGHEGSRLALDIAYHMVLPVLTLTLYNIALIIRLTRASMLQVVGQEYIKVAYAKGLSETVVLLKHALRNALLPVVTVIGLEFRTLIAGAVLTETVFAWPGLGRLTFDAIGARDYPLLMGMFLFISLLVIIGNLLTDIVYALLDPRIRYQ